MSNLQHQALLLYRGDLLRRYRGRGVRAASVRSTGRSAVQGLGPVLLLIVILTACGTVSGSTTGSGSGSVSLLVLLPRHSPTDRSDVRAIEAGIEATLAARGHRAGGRRVSLIEGSSSDPTLGTESFQSCSDIGARYAANPRIVGVVGPLTDECASGVVPALAQRGIAVVSPNATAPVFTHEALHGSTSGTCSIGQRSRYSLYGCEPSDFYPKGFRNYAHVVANVDRQGPAAAALFARASARRVFVVVPYGYDAWMLAPFRQEAGRLGVDVVAVREPDVYRPGRRSILRLARDVLASRANGLYLVGDQEADPAGRDAGLPPFLSAVRRAGFLGTIVGSFWKPNGLLVERAQHAAEGMYYTSTRLPLTALPAAASALASRLKLRGRYAVDAVYGAAAAEVLLDAIDDSDGTRAGVRGALFRVRKQGLLGSFRIDANGDVVPAQVAVLRAVRGSLVYKGLVMVGEAN